MVLLVLLVHVLEYLLLLQRKRLAPETLVSENKSFPFKRPGHIVWKQQPVYMMYTA